MTHPLAADFLLLAYNDETGKSELDDTRLHAALAGATVLELTVQGVLDIAGEDGPVKEGRLYRVPSRRASDPLLEEIAVLCEGKKPKDAISKVAGVTSFKNSAGEIKEALLERLAADGVLREEKAKVLGLFPTTRWPTVDPTYEQQVVDGIRSVVVDGAQPDGRTAALVSLLSAVDLVPKVLPDEDKKQVQARAKEIAESDWAADGVKSAVDTVNAIMITTMMTPMIIAGNN